MRVPLILLAATFSVGPALAQPAKHHASKAAERSTKPVEVVLAAADAVPAPASPALQPPVTPKRVAPRITHCRCGDPQPGDATPEE